MKQVASMSLTTPHAALHTPYVCSISYTVAATYICSSIATCTNETHSPTPLQNLIHTSAS